MMGSLCFPSKMVGSWVPCLFPSKMVGSWWVPCVCPSPQKERALMKFKWFFCRDIFGAALLFKKIRRKPGPQRYLGNCEEMKLSDLLRSNTSNFFSNCKFYEKLKRVNFRWQSFHRVFPVRF